MQRSNGVGRAFGGSIRDGGHAALNAAGGFAQRALRPVRRAAAAVMDLPVWVVLGAVLLAQWAAVAIIAAITPHNGTTFYSGGDDTWYWTSAWVLGGGHVPLGVISYGYLFLLAPIAHFAGASMFAGLPFVIALNLLVLWPIALLCVYGIAKTIGGRGFAYIVSFLWTLMPFASMVYFVEGYHRRLVDQTFPAALGLVATGDFPSMVFVLVAAYFALKAVSEASPQAALFAGLAAGFAATVKPSNLIFLPAPLVALVVLRRPRELALFGAGLMPALFGLVLWKYRGLGYVPAFSTPPATLAAAKDLVPPLADIRFSHYLRVDWSHLKENMYDIREYTWSLRMVTWMLAAGLIALFRRSAAVGIVIGGWLVSYIVLKASVPGVDVKSGAFFRYMQPAFPPFFFGLVSIPLLIPIFGRRLVASGAAERFWPVKRRHWRVLFGVAAVALAVPILAIAAFPPLTAQVATDVPLANQYVPTNTFPLKARELGDGSIVLTWPSQDERGTRVRYAVFRAPTDRLSCTPRSHAATFCVFFSDAAHTKLVPVGWTRKTSFRDHPRPGPWVYRVAATVSPYGPKEYDNLIELSRAARITASAY